MRIVRSGSGFLASSVSGIGSTWGRPRTGDGSTELITARTDGRRCKGGVSAAGEAPRRSSSCVALSHEKGGDRGWGNRWGRGEDEGGGSSEGRAFHNEKLDTGMEKPKTKTG